MQDRSGGRFRWTPQETLDDISAALDPLFNVLVYAAPYVVVLALGGSVLFALAYLRMEKVRGPHFTDSEQRRMRSIPLSIGLWGLIFMHVLLIAIPRATQAMTSNAYVRDSLEIATMAFGFFTMFGILHIAVQCALDPKLRKKLNIFDYAIIGQLMGVLGLGLYVWATCRHASIWTGAVAWQHFVDSWLFRQGADAPALGLPSLAKLYLFLGPIAAVTMLHSRVLTLMLIPNPKLWTFDRALLGYEVPKSHGRAAALIYGVSVEDDKQEDNGDA